MFPAARMTDPVTHDGITPCGLITGGNPTVLIEFMPAARVTDMITCTGVIATGIAHPPPPPTPPLVIVKGNPSVLIGGLPAGRWTIDTGACGVFLGNPALMATRKTFIGP